jgi:hypothetical protein
MAKRSAYAKFLDETMDAIDQYVSGGSGRHKQKVPLLRELASWATDMLDEPELLNELKPSFAKRAKEFSEVAAARDHVACALYAEQVLGMRRAKILALRWSKVSAGDLATVSRLVRAANLDIQRHVQAAPERIRYPTQLST